MAHKIKHIAVIRLSAMGDVAMTVPVLKAFANEWPEVKITMISRPMFEPFFSGIPNLTFVPFDAEYKHKGIMGLYRLFSQLKKDKVDAYADLHNVIRSKFIGILFALSGIKTATVDKARAEKKALTRIKNKVFQPLRPMVNRHADVFESLGFPLELSNNFSRIKLPITPDITDAIGMKNGQWIGIAPFAQHASKVYPTDLMQQVINEVAEINESRIFLFGSGQEKRALLEFAGTKKNVIVVSDLLDFRNQLILISNLDIMVSMDSGNAHIAAMYGVPVITLWGATHPYAGFAPFGQPLENTITADRTKFPGLPTSIYGNKKVPGYDAAMRTIIPGEVVSKVKSILAAE